MIRRALSFACLLAACGGGDRLVVPAATPNDDAAPPPAQPAPPPADWGVPAAPQADASTLVGWWRSDSVCLELFASGDFELTMQSAGPKIMVMGNTMLIPTAEHTFELRLAVARIWRARFTGPCRKIHELGRWTDSERVLGVEFKLGATAGLRLQRNSADQVELCGATCELLNRDTPVLAGRWRRAGIEYPDRPEFRWIPGDLLELAFDANVAHVWTGLPGGKWATANGELTARHVDGDRFALRFIAREHVDLPEGATPLLFEAPLAVGSTHELTARRTRDERLEVCTAGGLCGTLERQFDAYHHDID